MTNTAQTKEYLCALTDPQVAEARRLGRAGWTSRALADRFGVSLATMQCDLFGHRPRAIDGEVPPLTARVALESGVEVRGRIMSYITRYIRVNGSPPVVREIAAECDITSTSVVQYHLRRLEADGVISRRRGAARSIRVLDGARHREYAAGRYVMPGETVQVDVDGLVVHGAFVA